MWHKVRLLGRASPLHKKFAPSPCAAVAQLVEHTLGKGKVDGSIPFGSTTQPLGNPRGFVIFGADKDILPGSKNGSCSAIDYGCSQSGAPSAQTIYRSASGFSALRPTSVNFMRAARG